jgi:hypothetical protein
MKSLLVLALLMATAGPGEDLVPLASDRAAVERVYYQHRLGDKRAFETAVPRDAIDRLVRLDLRKESILRSVYHFEVNPGLVEAEVRRIDTTTRAPEVLAELKAALDHDPARFARTVARPLVVERELRARFENDSRLHAVPRREAEMAREALLAAAGQTAADRAASLERGHPGVVQVMTWHLGSRPAAPPAAHVAERVETPTPSDTDARGGASPDDDADGKLYFSELAPELQTVLRSQLHRPGDVSAVIETPRDFLLYLVTASTDSALTVAALKLPKRDYDQWIEELAAGTEDGPPPAAAKRSP